jgi:hypothetical protein
MHGTDRGLLDFLPSGVSSKEWNVNRLTKVLLGTAIGSAALAVSAMTASADIACNGNTCWHVKDHFAYPRESRIVVHRDTWKPGPHITIREHEGRGYWRGGSWVDF